MATLSMETRSWNSNCGEREQLCQLHVSSSRLQVFSNALWFVLCLVYCVVNVDFSSVNWILRIVVKSFSVFPRFHASDQCKLEFREICFLPNFIAQLVCFNALRFLSRPTINGKHGTFFLFLLRLLAVKWRYNSTQQWIKSNSIHSNEIFSKEWRKKIIYNILSKCMTCEYE